MQVIKVQYNSRDAYSYKPKSEWVNSHWMTINGKRDGFVRDDFYQFEKISPVFNKEFIDNTVNHTIEMVSQWANMAQTNNVYTKIHHVS